MNPRVSVQQQLEHGDVERDAGHRQPVAGLDAEARSMPAKKLTTCGASTITPLGLPGRARGVDHVGEITSSAHGMPAAGLCAAMDPGVAVERTRPRAGLAGRIARSAAR